MYLHIKQKKNKRDKEKVEKAKEEAASFNESGMFTRPLPKGKY